ncbi:MAG: hypothetical protein J0H50_10565 [Xanthomonadales bacterium]|nr:hypothetical protein [Xanthomonadales bacterium]
MHAQAIAVPAPVAVKTPLTPVALLRPGQHFIRLDSTSEVLVLMSYAGADAPDGEIAWAVVVAVNHDSEGYVPGQLLKLKRTTHVRRVHEARPATFALEQ